MSTNEQEVPTGEAEESQTPATEQTQEGQQEAEARGQTTSEDGSGSQTGFTNPRLAGKSPQEIEGLFSTYESAVREQGTQLNEMQRRLNSVEDRVEEEEEEIDFYDNPREAIRQEMRSMIGPLLEDQKERKALTVRQRLAEKYDDWNEVEPYVDMFLNQRGAGEEMKQNEAVLETVYWSVQGMKSKGMLGTPNTREGSEQSVNQNENQQPSRRQPPPAPPQNRPSNAPVSAPESENKEKLRPLTESERRLAKEYGMSHEEYLKWQDMDEKEVVGSNLGREES